MNEIDQVIFSFWNQSHPKLEIQVTASFYLSLYNDGLLYKGFR